MLGTSEIKSELALYYNPTEGTDHSAHSVASVASVAKIKR